MRFRRIIIFSCQETVFDINIEAFQQKPWRQHGIDLTDYFNFGLDEEGWRKYCYGMKQFTQGASSIAEQSSGMDQESHHNLDYGKLMRKSAIYSGFEGGNDIAKPKGRAIHVQGGVFERLPSADMWRPRERDSDVVIQVNMMLSPSNHSTSDDNSTVNDKCMTTERILVNDPGVKCLDDTSLLVDKVVHKEVLNGSSSECTGSKLDMRDSACTRDHSSSPRYSDMLSEESTEDCYFKRANRHPNSKAICSDTGPKDVYVKSDFCRHSSKSDQESTKGGSPSHTTCPADDRYHKTTTPLRTDEPDFVSSGVFMNRQSDHRLLKYGHQGRKEQKRKGSARVRHDVFEKEVKIADSYTSRYDRKYEDKRSSSTFLRNDWRNAVHSQVYEKRDYSPDERSAMRNGVHRFSAISNHHHNRFSSHEFNDDGDGVRSLSPPKGWQRRHDHGYGYNSVLRAELSDDIDRRMYRESYYQESRRVRHGHSEDDELLDYIDHQFGEFWEPEVRGKYRSRRSAERSGEHWRHPYHLVSHPRANDYPKNPEDWYVSPPRANDYPKNPERDWYVSPPRANDYPKNPERDWYVSPPRANDYPKNPERDWSSPSLTPLSSRNSRNAKIMQYHRDGYYQNDKHHNFSVHVDNIQQSAIYTAAPSETGYCILPVKRKLHAGRGSMNRKDLLGIAISKGRRLKHDQSMISDRQLYAVEVHNSPKETVREAIYSFSDMRNSNSISNIHDEGRHEHLNIHPEDADGIRLNDRKRKFKLQGNEIRRVESDNQGCLPADKDLHSFKHKDVHQKAQKLKLNRSHHQSVCHDLEKTTYQKRQTTNGEDEIEEGELVEEDHQDTVPNSKLNKPRKAVLKSVIEASSAGQLETINAMSKDICDEGATRECDDKHILKVMEKMQKRRERFKEPVVVAQKEEDNGKNELLAVACSTADDVKNQRPARKRRWGGNG